jgi:hypothetical protein
MIQDPSKDLTLIVYNTPKPPKYLKVNKKLITTIILVIPVLIISSISVSFLYSMVLKKQVVELKSSEPKIILGLKENKVLLESELDKLQKENALLTKKLSIGSVEDTASNNLDLFIKPLGINVLRSKELVKLEGLDVNTISNDISLTFNLANNSENNSKISGYLSIIMYQGNLIQYYPNYELGDKNLRLEFSKGETFSFSRFRPTEARFKKLSKQSARFKIYIFSRAGDLVSFSQVGPFNIE